MPEPVARKFTMADRMILFAGCAAGIAWTWSYFEENVREMVEIEWRFRLHYLIDLARPALASIGVALFVCRLRSPRPTLRRLARQPGTVAPACMILSFATEGAILLAGRALKPVVDRLWPIIPRLGGDAFTITYSSLLWTFTTIDPGPIIVASWISLMAVGRWKPEPTWIDRTGRCLGACWIISSFASRLSRLVGAMA